ncbi:hypothetical protein MUCCIDRAFT_111001 [Mucor lusitanicus CBS 277.49]|uniref:Uncharacterized protein n=1 Tax=Mucor lusitanicus CBS 277.49 TaxID=747725 RepID=A0A162QFQ1_MUCCL|nr:hypothetical protein MUCCIDRAFT_111001 [Mucor lusitanicus CBS 277.49]
MSANNFNKVEICMGCYCGYLAGKYRAPSEKDPTCLDAAWKENHHSLDVAFRKYYHQVDEAQGAVTTPGRCGISRAMPEDEALAMIKKRRKAEGVKERKKACLH